MAAAIDHPNIIPIYDAGRGRRAPLHRHALRPGPRSEGDPRSAGRWRRRGRSSLARAARQRARRRAHARARPPRREAGATSSSRRAPTTSTSRTSGSRSRRPRAGLTPPASSSAPSTTPLPSRSRGAGRRPHRRLLARLRPVRVPDGSPPFAHGTEHAGPARAPGRSVTVREPVFGPTCPRRSTAWLRPRWRRLRRTGSPRAESSPTPLGTRPVERHGGSTAARRVTWRRSPRLRLRPGRGAGARAGRSRPSCRRARPAVVESRPARD